MLSNFYARPPREELLLVVRDQSNSMAEYDSELNAACEMLSAKYGGVESRYAVHFIAFAGAAHASDASSIGLLRHVRGGTCIAPAFERACALVAKMRPSVQFSAVTLVFISDGEDNDIAQCYKDLDRLAGLQCPCRFICVGCRGFPTSLASGKLFEIFGTANHVCEPPVLPCAERDDVAEVFEQLCVLLDSPDAQPPPELDAIDAFASIADLFSAAKRAYNASVVLSVYRKSVPESEAFAGCKAILARIREKLVRHVHGLKAMQRSDPPAPVLLSKLVGAAPKATLLQQASSAMSAVEAMQKTVAGCLDMARRGELVAKLDDESKLGIVGFAAKFGKLGTKALRYHSVSAQRVKKSFLDFLENYPAECPLSVPLDAATRETTTGVSLFEVASDAARVIHALRGPDFTVHDLLEKYPQFGIPVRLAPLSKGAAMNCWLLHAVHVSLSSIVTVQELQSGLRDEEAKEAALREDSLGYLSDDEDAAFTIPLPEPAGAVPDERAPNCLVLLPSERPGPDCTYVRFAASALVYRADVYHHDALLGVMAAAVVNLLQRLPYEPAAAGTLVVIREALRRAYPKHEPFARYCARIADEGRFRECLATVFRPDGEQELRCEHLTKPVLAMWYLASCGSPWTAAQLERRLKAFVVELFHRARQGVVYAPVRYLRPLRDCVAEDAAEVLHPLAFGATLPKAAAEAVPRLMQPVRSLKAEQVVAAPRVDVFQVFGAAHHHFDYQVAKSVFHGLALSSGVGDEFVAEVNAMDIARQLHLAQIQDNQERCTAPDFDKQFSQEEFEKAGYAQALAYWRKDAAAHVQSAFSEAYADAMDRAHSIPVVRLSAEHVRAWSADTGVDAAAALDLDAKGFSRTACLCPSCPYYLRPLGFSNRPGRASPALKAHLRELPQVPGLHKAVLETMPKVKGESLDEYAARVADVIRQGLHLEKGHPEAKKMRAFMDRAWHREKVTAVADRLEKYPLEIVLQIERDFGGLGQLESAVLEACSSRVLARDETFSALGAVSKHLADAVAKKKAKPRSEAGGAC